MTNTDPITVTVRCADGEARHEPFASMAEAREWAEWGHCCLAQHSFTRNVG